MSHVLSFVLLVMCIILMVAHFMDIKNTYKKNGE